MMVTIFINTKVNLPLDCFSPVIERLEKIFCNFSKVTLGQYCISREISASHFIFKNIEQLELRIRDNILLKVNCIQRVRHLIVISCKNDEYKLKFENLNFPYAQTEFKLYFSSPQNQSIKTTCSQMHGFLSQQRCTI